MSDALTWSPSDELAIRGLVQQLQDGWNAHDGVAFAAPFAQDADFVVVNGMHLRGHEAIAAGHVQIFNTIYRDSHNELTVERVRLIRDDVAIAHVRAHLVIRSGNMTEETRARFSVIAVKTADKWEFAAFQNTPIQEPRR